MKKMTLGLAIIRGTGILLLTSFLPTSSRVRAETLSWFQGENGSFNDPNSWLVPSEATFMNGKIKDPNPNKRVPGAGDDVGFTREKDSLPSTYEVSITGGSVTSFAAGSYNLPALTQPLTFNIAGTMSGGRVDLRNLITVKGHGELSGDKDNHLNDVTITDGTTLRLTSGDLTHIHLTDKSKAILTDVSISAPALMPTEGLKVIDSTLQTSGKIAAGRVDLSAGSTWLHEGDGLSGNISMEGGSLFQSSGKVLFGNLTLKESSSFTAGSLSNYTIGLSVSRSGLFAKSAFLQGGPFDLFPRDISDDSSVAFDIMELAQGWLRIQSRSKLKNGTVKMGTQGGSGIIVTGKGSEWTVTNHVENVNVRVLDGGEAMFGSYVTGLSARVEGPDSRLEFDTAIDSFSVLATAGGSILGQNLDFSRGGGSSSQGASIYLVEGFNFGLGNSCGFNISGGGSIECTTSVMGLDEGGDAAMTINGEGSLWRVRKTLSMSEYPAIASLTIEQGGKAIVGIEAAPSGSVTVGGSSSITISGANSVFDTRFVKETTLGEPPSVMRKPASVKVLGGGGFWTRKLLLGNQDSANVTVQGAGSSIIATESMFVGWDGGQGTLTLREGARGRADTLEIGESRPSSVLLTGSGSEFTVLSEILVGSDGTGTLTVADKAKLSVEESPGLQTVSLAANESSKGTMIVDGASADLKDRTVVVGFGGTGILTVSGGGSLNASNCIVGFSQTSSSGSALVTGKSAEGTRSSLRITDKLSVGFFSEEGAAAAFDVNASGAVRVGKTVDITPRGTLRFNGGSLVAGVGGDSENDCVLWPGGTLILEPGGALIGGPGQVKFEGGTITTRLKPFAPPPPSSPQARGSLAALAASRLGTATISAAVTMNPTATTIIELAPGSADASQAALRVTGPVVLDGKLILQFKEGFAPTAGQKFKLFDFQGTVGGKFAQIEITGLAPGFQYDFKPDASNAYTLTTLNDGVAISAPLLSLARTGNDLVISWPQTARGYTLQTCSDLGAANWQPLSAATNPFRRAPTPKMEFFRLVKP
jgi:T5SS/PEP-CTERM-associated repeat protein